MSKQILEGKRQGSMRTQKSKNAGGGNALVEVFQSPGDVALRHMGSGQVGLG